METSEQIPVVDIRRLDDAPAVLAELDHASRNCGFFQVVNHGVESELIAALRAQMRAFFALPIATKRAIERTAENTWASTMASSRRTAATGSRSSTSGRTVVRDPDLSLPYLMTGRQETCHGKA